MGMKFTKSEMFWIDVKLYIRLGIYTAFAILYFILTSPCASAKFVVHHTKNLLNWRPK